MEPIAVVGMSCRFPGANGSGALWKLLRDGADAITEIPPDRWDVERWYAPTPEPGKMYTRWGGFLDEVDRFDAEFFGISAREASFMDPQQRVVLEVAWEALEDAGMPPAGIGGSNTGVFVGVSNYDYNRLICRDPATMDAYSSTGTILAITANRLSYLLNLRGPSLAIDTACSSSLVSVHLASQSLREGESDLAIAGGVNLILSPEVTVILSQGGLMSPDGRCKSFDSSANGYVRSEGCGIVILQRLSDALREGRTIHALIRGSATNQDGLTNGLTAPSGTAQQRVIRRALANAGVSARELSYVEAHGSGTRLGDIIEWRALKAVLFEDGVGDQSCAVGSIKSNIGHTESASGIAGLLKVILALGHETIPPNLHLKQMDAHLRGERAPLFVPTEPRPWTAGGAPRFAGVSSFGLGGTNAHVILESARPSARALAPPPGPYVLPISSATPHGLRALVQRYDAFLAEHDERLLADVAYTAACGRSHFTYRAVLTGDSLPLAQHYLNGETIDWRALYAAGEYRFVPLPTYIFDRKRYWFDEVEPRLRSRTVSEVRPYSGGPSMPRMPR